MIFDLLQDGFFAAVAAIGFGSISNIPIKSFAGCALLAAIGHASRYALMTGCEWNIITASFAGALVIGLLSIPFAKIWHCPAEALSFPALLPMIPGMYAYHSVQAFLMCLQHSDESGFSHYFYLFNYNWIVCVLTMVMMVVGTTLPLFIFRAKSFSATR